MTEASFTYEGGELELFAQAVNWKRYWSAHVRPYLGKRVLEVGAGIGANTPYLNRNASEWICLEPDENMAAFLVAQQRARQLPPSIIKVGTIAALPITPAFDSIVYIDVLEHIRDDADELMQAAKRLVLGGTLIVLVPAHNWLYSPFDRSIGHYRRYSASALRGLTCPGFELLLLRHLDCVGLSASAVNRVFLKREIPTKVQILFWDRILVPISRFLDPLLMYRIGKSILAIWRRVPTI